MQIDEISYLDQLYEDATELDDRDARDKFIETVWKLWPEISATFDEHKHSL
jgi:hypothetical protein